MSHHVAGILPDGTSVVLADYWLPVVAAMRRQLRAMAEYREPDPADATLIEAWAVQHPEQVCAHPLNCEHPEEGQ